MPLPLDRRGLTDENGLINSTIPFPMIMLLLGLVVLVVGAILRNAFARSGTSWRVLLVQNAQRRVTVNMPVVEMFWSIYGQELSRVYVLDSCAALRICLCYNQHLFPLMYVVDASSCWGICEKITAIVRPTPLISTRDYISKLEGGHRRRD